MMTQNTRCLIAGNWKMNGTTETATPLAEAIVKGASSLPGTIALTICPPFTLLDRVGRLLTESNVALGAQDCRAEAKGAHTGDISAPMLADLGVRYVILGHSERRAEHVETDAQIRAKAIAAQEAGLVPILCIGETVEERDSGRANDRLSAQIEGSVPPGFQGVIAYEPIWAIGTGRTASSEEIADTTAHIRDALARHAGSGDNTPRILYGGSVTPKDAAAIFSIETVGGVLVGGASLVAESFLGIAREAVATRG